MPTAGSTDGIVEEPATRLAEMGATVLANDRTRARIRLEAPSAAFVRPPGPRA